MKKNTLIAFFTTTLFCQIVCAENSKFFFSSYDVPTIQKKIKTAKLAPVWDEVLCAAKGYCDPNSSSYADIAKADIGFEDRELAGRGHFLGRRLTDWSQTTGLVYKLTGDRHYGQHGAALVAATANSFPVTNKWMEKVFAGGRGDMMRGLAIGYNLLSDEMTEEQRIMVEKVSAGYIENFITEAQNPGTWWHKYHNYNGVCGGAAGLLAIALKDAYPEKSKYWVDTCTKIVVRWLDNSFDEQGAYLEGIAYSGYGLSNATIFADALLHNGGPNLFEHPHLQKVANYYAMSVLPGEKVCDARNDSAYASLEFIPLILAKRQDSGLAKWLWDCCGKYYDSDYLAILWDNDVVPIDPLSFGTPLDQYFEGRGLCIWRTGWEKDDIMYSIEAGPYYPVIHNQADKGHFTLYGLGNRWAIDTGKGSREGRASTLAHSCVLIDGKGQAVSGEGLGTNGKILDFVANDQYGYALADCTEAYNHNIVHNDHEKQIFNQKTDASGISVLHALRHTFFIKPAHGVPAYVVILDDIQKNSNAHTYTWQMLTSMDNNVFLDDSSLTISPKNASATLEEDSIATPAKMEETCAGVRMKMHIQATAAIELSKDIYSPGDGRKPASYHRLRASTEAVNPRFSTILLPMPKKIEDPTVSFSTTSTDTQILVSWPTRRDVIRWPTKGKPSVEITKLVSDD